MKISAMEEYGLRCLLQLARSDQAELLSAENIAEREGLSIAYVEKILSQLRKANLIKSVRGMYGGYQLTRAPQEIRVGDLMRALDGDFFTELCNNFSGNQDTCIHLQGCSIRPVWLMVVRHLYRILDSLSLQDLIDEESHVDRHLFAKFPLQERLTVLLESEQLTY